jgi:hypothetical protein
MAQVFRIHSSDNVATVLEEGCGRLEVTGAGGAAVEAAAPVPAGHKVALAPIAAGEGVVKFGVRIGHATVGIRPGEWVHLHNLASDHDERAGTLDVHTGAPTDTRYE